MSFFLFPPENSEFQLQPLSNMSYIRKGGVSIKQREKIKRSLRYSSIGKELLFHFFSLELYWLNKYAWNTSCAPRGLEMQRRV